MNKKGDFLTCFKGALGTSLLWNLLTGKGVKAKIPGQRVRRAGEGRIRAGQDF